ncbi:hypothetical protein V8E36_001184 [Tilletia maclaganii]
MWVISKSQSPDPSSFPLRAGPDSTADPSAASSTIKRSPSPASRPLPAPHAALSCDTTASETTLSKISFSRREGPGASGPSANPWLLLSSGIQPDCPHTRVLQLALAFSRAPVADALSDSRAPVANAPSVPPRPATQARFPKYPKARRQDHWILESQPCQLQPGADPQPGLLQMPVPTRLPHPARASDSDQIPAHKHRARLSSADHQSRARPGFLATTSPSQSHPSPSGQASSLSPDTVSSSQVSLVSSPSQLCSSYPPLPRTCLLSCHGSRLTTPIH